MIPKIMWAVFFAISAIAVGTNWSPQLLEIRNSYSYGKILLWIAYFAFVAYGLYATKHEDFFRAIKKIGAYYWGRQVGIDLYIGFIFFIFFIGFHQGPWAAMIWTVPVLIYGNQLTLLYLAIHYESILQKLTAS